MRVGGAEKAKKGYCMLGSLGRDRDFPGHDMVLRLQAIAGSRLSCFSPEYSCVATGFHGVVS